MSRKLPLKYQKQPSVIINRTAFKDTRLVYVARANRKLRYKLARSRIVYIGTTRVGANRIAVSAAKKGEELLSNYGVKHLEFNIVVCGRLQGVETWRKLERALIIRFRELYSDPPKANKTGEKMRWKDERQYFSLSRLDKIIAELSK
ncbi:MAG: hypothetical protein ABSA64_01210 [Sedimentisphaerales bacterium]|jgi:hypothetical protein